jgi:hypothetical protein
LSDEPRTGFIWERRLRMQPALQYSWTFVCDEYAARVYGHPTHSAEACFEDARRFFRQICAVGLPETIPEFHIVSSG